MLWVTGPTGPFPPGGWNEVPIIPGMSFLELKEAICGFLTVSVYPTGRCRERLLSGGWRFAAPWKGRKYSASLRVPFLPRRDVALDKYHDYQKSAYRDFISARLVGSVNSGVVVDEESWLSLRKVLNDFVVHKDIKTAQSEFEAVREFELNN